MSLSVDKAERMVPALDAARDVVQHAGDILSEERREACELLGASLAVLYEACRVPWITRLQNLRTLLSVSIEEHDQWRKATIETVRILSTRWYSNKP